MQHKILKRLLPLLFILTAASCNDITIPDEEWCGDMGAAGATCYHTLKTDTRDLTKADWDSLRFGQVCTDAANFAKNKAILEKLCNGNQNCNYEQTSNFVDKVNAIRNQ